MDERLPASTPRPEREAGASSPVAALHLPGLLLEELRTWLVAEGQPRYRADQIFDWIFNKRATALDRMTNLPGALRARLAAGCTILRAAQTRRSVSRDGTQKLLLTWPDGVATETVWIPDELRNTACLSSQAGCPVGCRFCATGIDGLQRNLTAGEIVEQALRAQRIIEEAGGAEARLSNIVMMGMGEPLANYAEVVKALRILNAPWGLGIGARRITVSTVGLPKQIRQLADENFQFNLALSLHAADEALRRELIPWGRIPLAELLDACDYYFQRTGREITLEYVLLAGVNDLLTHARQLVQVAKRLRCNINLLRYNPVPGLPYRRPTADAAYAFQEELRAAGVNVHLRTSRGQDIDAACGQLRRREASRNDLGGPATPES